MLEKKFEKKGNLLEQLREAVNAEPDKFDQEKVDAINDDIQKLSNEIESIERANKLLSEKQERVLEKNEDPEKPDNREALNTFLRTGENGLVESGNKNKRALEIRANQFYKGTDNKGGYLVPDEISNVIDSARAYVGGMVTPGVVSWDTVSDGRKIEYPNVDDTSVKAAVIGEKTDMASGTDVTYGISEFDFYKITTKTVKISNELIQDAAFDVVGHVLGLLMERMMRGLNYYFTVGSGSSMPYGIKTLSSEGESATKRGITRADINNLIYSVNRAYRPGGLFQMNDSTIKAIRALYVGSADARPLWQDSMQAGEPALLEGYPVVANPDIEEIHPTYDTVYFGDFKKFQVFEALPMKIIRLDELYAETDEVGFNVLGRWASNKVTYTSTYPFKHIHHATT